MAQKEELTPGYTASKHKSRIHLTTESLLVANN